MLNLIIQGQEEKVAVDSYRVSDSKYGNRICGFLNGTVQGELASYKKAEDATRVFWDMVLAEAKGMFIQLPKDDPKEIASFSELVKTTATDECFCNAEPFAKQAKNGK